MNPATPVSAHRVRDRPGRSRSWSCRSIPASAARASSRRRSTRSPPSRAHGRRARRSTSRSTAASRPQTRAARGAGRRQCAGRRLRRVQGRRLQGQHRGDPPRRRRWRAGKRPMIPRYSRPEMVAIWSPETKFRIWFEIEAHAADAMAELGIIPKERRAENLGEGQRRQVRRRPHRRDRARGQARRHRLPDPSVRNRRARKRASCIRA